MEATALKNNGLTLGMSGFSANDRDETLKPKPKPKPKIGGPSRESSFMANDRDDDTNHAKLLKINKEMSEE